MSSPTISLASHMNPSTVRTHGPKKPLKEYIVKFFKKVRGSALLPNASASNPITTTVHTANSGMNESSSSPPTSVSPPISNIDPNAVSSRGNTSSRKIIAGYTKAGLKVTAAVAEAVPGVGTIIKGTIGTVLEILEAIERIADNKEKIAVSMQRLRSLLRRIKRISAAGKDENWHCLCESVLTSFHESIVIYNIYRELVEAQDALKKLCDQPRISLATEAIVQVLQQCHEDIQDALTRYTALSQMDSHQIVDDIRKKVCQIELYIQNGFGTQEGLPLTIKSTVTIIDATGHEFGYPAAMAIDPEVNVIVLLPPYIYESICTAHIQISQINVFQWD
ncbi:hypothetical protein VKT23_000103 [Stygiomarasmius scandens]|uniref:NACHT-NTPase and P-loop NTPases N-terminal domain-containing protein n=1 Tax=Marasmiellus scandens TaxID=2682957 RepID=A0ABR1K6L7_9AGAR